MKTILLISLVSLLISACSSGEGGYDYCVQESVKNGNSLEDAQDRCGEIRDENGIQN